MTSLPLIIAASTALLGLSELPPQQARPGHCLTFLWLKRADPLRIAMIDEQAQTMRLARGKTVFDIAATAPGRFEGDGYRITVQLNFGERPGLVEGDVIDSGSMRIETAADKEPALSFPVGGIRSCR